MTCKCSLQKQQFGRGFPEICCGAVWCPLWRSQDYRSTSRFGVFECSGSKAGGRSEVSAALWQRHFFHYGNSMQRRLFCSIACSADPPTIFGAQMACESKLTASTSPTHVRDYNCLLVVFLSLSLCLFLWVILKRVQRCQHVQKYAKQYHKSCTHKKKSCNTVLYHPSFLWHHASFPDLPGLGNIVLAGLLPKISTSHAIQFHSAIEQPVKQAATWCTWITAQWNEEVWIWWRLTQCTTQLCVQCRWA